MKPLSLFIAFVGMLVMSSCSSIYHTSTTSSADTRLYSMAVADLDVSPLKAEATYYWDFNPFKRVNIETVKSNTTARLLLQNEADVLVEPQYIVEKRGFLRGGSVKVVGFPAKYTNFHKPTPEETLMVTELIKAGECKRAPRKKFILF